MIDFKYLIKEALTNVGEIYYKQPTVKDGEFKYGERVFCYELYHQLRCMQERFKDLVISGEAVKSKFQSQDLENNKMPDMLIHNFGMHENNEVIIEAKTDVRSVKKDIEKDFEILNTFTHSDSCFNYKLGISLVVNHDLKEYLSEQKDKLDNIKSIIDKNPRIELWNIINPEFDRNGRLKMNSIKVYSVEEILNF
ncbi:MAG: hypothetical protein GQ564_15605 [Bacteroidales bacterium]|nr:hypothetical protein [Bacteroidales bacterium]